MSVDWDVRPAWAARAPDDGPAPRSRRRRVAVALATVAVVALLAVVALEWWVRGEAATQVESGLAAAGVTGDVEVSVGDGAAPSVLRAAALGRLDRVRVGVRDGLVGGVPVVRADYELRDLEVDVDPAAGTVSVRELDEGSVRLRLDPVVVGAAVGTDLRAVDGGLRLGPERVAARARVVGPEVVVSPVDAADATPELRVPAADPYLLPCRPRVEVVGDLLQLSCTGSRLPGVLAAPLAAAGTPAGTGGGGPSAPVADLPAPQTTVRAGG